MFPESDYRLTQKEVAEHLRMTVENVRWLRRTGRLPYQRLGHRTIRFREMDVRAFEAKSVVQEERGDPRRKGKHAA